MGLPGICIRPNIRKYERTGAVTFNNMIIVHALFLLLFIYLAANVGWFLVVAVAGKFGAFKSYAVAVHKNRIAVIIPSYKEDAIIVDTAEKAAHHNYPSDRFTVVVVADKLQPATVEKLRAIPVRVIEVDANMKSRSVNTALHQLDAAAFDIAVLLDADNIMGADCLEKINDAFTQGCRAVQCHRTAKNQHTPVALLDAISEEININLFRRGPAAMGISPAPIGSGMAFEFALLKQIFSVEHILSNPGEDREIDMQLMKQRIFMHYIDDAYVYDEKVASSGVFEKQRVRWLEAQINHLRRFFDPEMKDAPKTPNYCIKFFQTLLLPRLLLIMVLGLLSFVLVLQWLLHFSLLFPADSWWISLIVLYALVLLLSVPRRFYNMDTMRAVMKVPGLMLAMLRALLRVKTGRKEFLHTPKEFK